CHVCCPSVLEAGLPSAMLFPYTTLFRSRGAAGPPASGVAAGLPARLALHPRRGGGGLSVARLGAGGAVDDGRPGAGAGGQFAARSEEHTSELQSRENLVCRLLLEKKK